MSKLIILVGIPGSGKSSFAKKLKGKYVGSDCIRKELYGGESITFNEEISDLIIREKGISLGSMNEKELRCLKKRLCEDYVFILARKECCRLLKEGNDVVYDSTNFKKEYRKQLLLEAKGLYDTCEAFVMDVPLETAVKRNNSRQRKEPESIIREIGDAMEFPVYSEGFDKIYTVDCSSDIRLIPKSVN